MEQETDIILPASRRKLRDPINNFDDALREIFETVNMELITLMPDENGDVDYTGNNKDADIHQYLETTLNLDMITVTYPLDYNNVLNKVSFVYNRDEVKDVRGLLRVIGEFYDRRLTYEQLIILREKDLMNDVNFMEEDEDKVIYNALIHLRGQITTLAGVEGADGVYEVSLD